MSGPFDVAILGAGPAGLSAALAAARRGFHVVVLERAPRVGGLSASFELAGHHVDHGSHRLHTATPPEIMATLGELLGDELQLRRRNGRIRLEGRWLAFPLQPRDVLRNAPASLTLAAMRDLALTPIRWRRAAAPTFAGQVRQQLGPAIASRFYEPYARKLWGVDAHELSAELARRRVAVRSPGGLVRRMLTSRDPAASSFWYPRRGFGRISEALADAAVTAGAELRLGTEVTTSADVASMTTTIVSTLPAAGTVALYGDGAPVDVREAGTTLTYRGALLVYLVVDKRRYTAFDAHYLPDPAVPVARVSEPKNYRDDPEEPAQTTVLCAEIPSDPDGPLWTASGADLSVIVSDALLRSGLPPIGHIAQVRVKRVPNVYPIYRLGFEHSLQLVEDWAAGRDELMLVGRQALFAHDNTHHAMAMGQAAAACLRDDGSVDRAAWTGARESFRNHVVED